MKSLLTRGKLGVHLDRFSCQDDPRCTRRDRESFGVYERSSQLPFSRLTDCRKRKDKRELLCDPKCPDEDIKPQTSEPTTLKIRDSDSWLVS